MKNRRGVTLVELMIAVVIISVTLMAIPGSFAYIMKSLIQTRMRAQVIQFAKAEIEDMERYAKYTDTSGGKIEKKDINNNYVLDSSGEHVWIWPYTGYNTILSSPTTAISYPKNFAGDVMSSNMSDLERYQLYRTIVSSNFSPATDYEYKLVTVTLTDTKVPGRFSPVTMQTRIKKPDQIALDTRTSTDVGRIYGKVTDIDNPSAPLTGVSVYIKSTDGTVSPPSQATNNDGYYEFSSLDASKTYIITYNKLNWWNETKSGPVNIDYSVTMQKIYFATVNITITNYASLAGVPNASVRVYTTAIDYKIFSSLGLVPPYPASYTYESLTNSYGLVTFKIPIPVKGASTYNSYKVRQVTCLDYITIAPYTEIYLNRDVPANLNYKLVPCYYGNLNIKIVAASFTGQPIPYCFMDVTDNGDESWSVILASGAKTDTQGTAQFYKIRTNSNLLPERTVRRVLVRPVRVGYETIEEIPGREGTTTDMNGIAIEVEKDQNRSYSIALLDHHMVLTASMITPNSTTSSRVPVYTLGTRQFTVSAQYHGHKRFYITGTSTYDTPNRYGDWKTIPVSSILKHFQWTFDPADSNATNVGWLTCAAAYNQTPTSVESSSGPAVSFYAKNIVAPISLFHFLRYEFTYPAGGKYGSPTQDETVHVGYLPDPNNPIQTSYINVVSNTSVGAPAMSVTITGNNTILPNATQTYSSNVTFVNMADPGSYTYNWSIVSGNGVIDGSNTNPTVSVRPTAAFGIITLRLVVNAPLVGMSAESSVNILITVPNITLSVTTPDGNLVEPGNTAHIAAAAEGGTGGFTYFWTTCDALGTPQATPTQDSVTSSSISSTTGSLITFLAGFPGTVYIKCTATDNSGNSMSSIVEMTIQPQAQMP